MEQHHHSAEACCPECGAPAVEGMTCWEQLGAILAWEAHDPELLAEHFLTVASYNLQHPAQFTEEALAGLRSALIERLDANLPIAEIRRRAGRANAGSKRVLKPEAERRPVLREWAMTVAGVYLPGQPEGAAARVRAWAAAIRRAL
ncbi:MAG TPA: DUF5946 family protein [Roseiflexaceae bacterium]|nr:DUF5946 family protein [Roseiflexaceae bacterium]